MNHEEMIFSKLTVKPEQTQEITKVLYGANSIEDIITNIGSIFNKYLSDVYNCYDIVLILRIIMCGLPDLASYPYSHACSNMCLALFRHPLYNEFRKKLGEQILKNKENPDDDELYKWLLLLDINNTHVFDEYQVIDQEWFDSVKQCKTCFQDRTSFETTCLAAYKARK